MTSQLKISVQGEQCFPIVKLMAEHLKAAGYEAYADIDGFPRGQDVLWYVGCFNPIQHTFEAMHKLYPKLKTALQWAGSDILWTSPNVPHGNANLYVAPCESWAREVSEKFSVTCESIHLTPIKVHPLSPLPEKPRILIYGHWSADGGLKYQLPMILEECRRHAHEADFHVIGDGWRDMRVNHITYHHWIDDFDAKVEFFKGMSGLIYMPKPHEEHKYGGFVSLTPIEFAQMGRQVLRNGEYPFMLDSRQLFPMGVMMLSSETKEQWREMISSYYSSEYAPGKCQTRLKEVIKQLV